MLRVLAKNRRLTLSQLCITPYRPQACLFGTIKTYQKPFTCPTPSPLSIQPLQCKASGYRYFRSHFSFFPKLHSSSISAKPTEYVFSEAQALSRLLHRTQRFQRSIYISSGFLLFGTFTLFYNWDFIKKRMGREGAEVLREGIESENLQITAANVSKTLLYDLFQDNQLINVASKWLLQLLKDSEEEICEFLVRLLHSPIVYNKIRSVADSIVLYLCSEEWVQEKVGQLLVKAINTPYAQNSAAIWIVDILSREDVCEKLRSVAHMDVLNNECVQKEAIRFANRVVIDVLQDPDIIIASQSHLSNVMTGNDFQNFACDAAWNVFKKTFAPRWLALSTSGTSQIPSTVNHSNDYLSRLNTNSEIKPAIPVSQSTSHISEESLFDGHTSLPISSCKTQAGNKELLEQDGKEEIKKTLITDKLVPSTFSINPNATEASFLEEVALVPNVDDVKNTFSAVNVASTVANRKDSHLLAESSPHIPSHNNIDFEGTSNGVNATSYIKHA